MSIERVRIVKTLKCGTNMYWVGQVFPERDGEDIPPDLLTEVRQETGTVEVLLETRDEEPKQQTRKLISRK